MTARPLAMPARAHAGAARAGRRLSAGDLAVLRLLASRADQRTRRVTLSAARGAEVASLSERTWGRAVQRLEAAGMLSKKLSRRQRGRRSNAYVLRFALDQDPDHPEVWEQLGKARYGLATDMQAGRARATEPLEVVLTQSREALERAISLAPDRPFAHLYLGLAYKLSGRQRPAELELRRALAPGTGGIHAAVLGDHLADLDRFEEAESIFQQALEDYPACAMAWRDYGRTLIRDRHPRGDENLPRAADAFERALLLQPENAENHYRLADVLSCIHEDFLPRAKALLERCLELRPSHPRASGTLAEVERLLRAGGG